MKWDDLNKQLRLYETASDICIAPDIYMVARLDGKNFTNLTKSYEKPFDEKFSNLMRCTTKNLMSNYGISFLYGYTQSDEISLLFNLQEDTFNRKLRKLNSVLAGAASSEFTYHSGIKACFDCRISQLPTVELVQDYFSWRQEDATRNFLNAYTFWTLRENNYSSRAATSVMYKLNKIDKIQLLLNYGINFNTITSWQKRGISYFFKAYMKEGYNPIFKESTLVIRRKLTEDLNLYNGASYRNYINNILKDYE